MMTAIADDLLLNEICDGNDDAFTALVERYHAAMVRVARANTNSEALAEEAVQEAWIAILRGYRKFEHRSSLKTWMFRIVINRARTHAENEHRGDWLRELNEPSIDERRFDPSGHWVIPTRSWTPEEHCLAGELRQHIDAVIARLPQMQRQVIALRDIYGWSAEEVCGLYDISDSNQRILLHRARAKVRQALEEILGVEERLCPPV
jgi:RNA polymerase sigma-70 factor, ECF subfamily